MVNKIMNDIYENFILFLIHNNKFNKIQMRLQNNILLFFKCVNNISYILYYLYNILV